MVDGTKKKLMVVESVRWVPAAVIMGLLACWTLASCGDSRQIYQVTYLDTTSFDYSIIRVKSDDDSSYIVLSKNDTSALEASSKEQEPLRLGSSYALTLRSIEPPNLTVQLRGRASKMSGFYIWQEGYDTCSIENGLLFWEEGKILVPVYGAEELTGRAVETK